MHISSPRVPLPRCVQWLLVIAVLALYLKTSRLTIHINDMKYFRPVSTGVPESSQIVTSGDGEVKVVISVSLGVRAKRHQPSERDSTRS